MLKIKIPISWSVPLQLLGWKPVPGQRLRGDIGLLRGRDGVTVQRIYWQNQATNIVEDIPSEAALVPALWGIIEVQRDAQHKE